MQCTGGDHTINAQGITLCTRCTIDLERDLRDVPDVWADIQTTAARLDVGAGTVGSSGHSAPSEPVNLDALDKAQTLRVVLGGWASHLPQLHPAGNPVKTALWLAAKSGEIRRQEWAGDFKRELSDALNACRWATDRSAERMSLGPCLDIGCPGIMTAIVGARTARCKLCTTTGDVRAMQQWIIAEAWHVVAFLPDIVRWLDRSGHAKVNLNKANVWVHRGKLDPVACDVASKRPLYTPADVVATYRETPTGRRDMVGTQKQVELVA